MQRSEDADILIPFLLVLAAIVGIGVYHTYIAPPDTKIAVVEPANVD